MEKREHIPPLFNDGEIWWCRIGENIGTEIGGKGQFFSRPVLIIKKLDFRSFIGIPITSRIKKGSWYHQIHLDEKECTAVLIQISYFDHRRMDKLICTISPKNLESITIKTLKLFKYVNRPLLMRADVGNPKT